MDETDSDGGEIMSISAMKQALDLLETSWGNGHEDTLKYWNETAQVLRQAIEQAEKQEPSLWFAIGKDGRVKYTTDSDRAIKWKQSDSYRLVRDYYTAPVHASDIPQERVDETAKRKHDLWIAAACLKSTVESAIKAGDWKVDGACDPTRDLAYLADCLANPKREWIGLTDEEFEEILRDFSHNPRLLAVEIEIRLTERNI